MLFFWTFYSSENSEKLNVSPFLQKHCAARLFSTLITIINVSGAANQHIRMIYEDDTRVISLKLKILTHIQMQNYYKME